jgi:hypothetical protein
MDMHILNFLPLGKAYPRGIVELLAGDDVHFRS